MGRTKKKAAGGVAAASTAQQPAKAEAPSTSHPPAAAPAAAASIDEPKDSKKRAKSAIDDIFSVGKKAKQDAGTTQQEEGKDLPPELQELADKVKEARQKQVAQGGPPNVEGTKDDIFGEGLAQARKRTEEGYAIYKEDELALNKKGGDTDLCPFDCDCCF